MLLPLLVLSLLFWEILVIFFFFYKLMFKQSNRYLNNSPFYWYLNLLVLSDYLRKMLHEIIKPCVFYFNTFLFSLKGDRSKFSKLFSLWKNRFRCHMILVTSKPRWHCLITCVRATVGRVISLCSSWWTL